MRGREEKINKKVLKAPSTLPTTVTLHYKSHTLLSSFGKVPTNRPHDTERDGKPEDRKLPLQVITESS